MSRTRTRWLRRTRWLKSWLNGCMVTGMPRAKTQPRKVPPHIWEQVRAAFFEDTRITIRALARRFEIPEASLRMRASLEQWRSGRISQEVAKRSKAFSPRSASPAELKGRILTEAAGWLDEIQELHRSCRYSKAESIKRLLPLWSKVVAVIAEQSKDAKATNAPLVSMNFLSGEGFSPRPVVDIDAETGD